MLRESRAVVLQFLQRVEPGAVHSDVHRLLDLDDGCRLVALSEHRAHDAALQVEIVLVPSEALRPRDALGGHLRAFAVRRVHEVGATERLPHQFVINVNDVRRLFVHDGALVAPSVRPDRCVAPPEAVLLRVAGNEFD